jgi:6-phosphogluconolactonase
MTRLLSGGYSGNKGAGTGIAVADDNEVTSVVATDCPSWIARHPDLPVLYAVAETDNGHVHAWSLVDGAPGGQLGLGDTGGSEPAHLTVDPSGRYLITANYSGGSISVHRLGPDGSIGERTDLIQHEAHGDNPRQQQAHPHMIYVAGGGLLVTDLGGDAIYRYQLTPDGKLWQEGVIPVPPGSGPRHLLTVGDRMYVTAEMSGHVLVFDVDWQLIGAVPASASTGDNQPSDLVSDGHFLYVGNRGPDSVAVFELDGRLPRYITEVPVGRWPRNLALDGDQLYVANERSNSVMVMTIDDETGIPTLADTIDVPSPTVVLP